MNSLPLLLALALMPTGDRLHPQHSQSPLHPLRAEAPDGRPGRPLRVDAELLLELRALSSAEIALPLPEGGAVTLSLARIEVAASGARLFVDGTPVPGGAAALAGDLSLWSGRVAGELDGGAFLALSRHGARGTARFGNRDVRIVAEPGAESGWRAPVARVIDAAELAPAHGRSCDAPPATADPLRAGRGAPRLATPHGTSAPLLPLLECRVVLETDHEYYQLFGDLDAARTYALTLLGAVGDTYRAQVGAILTAPYVGLYTTAADPWSSPDTGFSAYDYLVELSAAWTTGMPAGGDVGHLLSGKDLFGGAGWLAALCEADYRFSVTTGITAAQPFPPVPFDPLNDDYGLMAHELGHNFGAIHTHEYCPPLDECAPAYAFGPCQTQQVCSTQGTFMSYCGICPGGSANISNQFHAQSIADMRAFIDQSCLHPFAGAFSEAIGGALQGSAGPAPSIAASYSAAADALAFGFADAPADGLGFLVLGGGAWFLPILGGTLVPSPDLVTSFPYSGPTPSVSFSLLKSYPSGAGAYAQGWFLDQGNPELFAASAGLAFELIVPDPPAPLTWLAHPTNGKEYATGTEGSWYHARGEAEVHGGELVAITDAALEAWLKASFYDSGLAQGALWIGMTDELTEGTWHWTTGDPVTHTHFAPGFPTDGGGYDDVAYWFWGDIWYSAFGYYWFAGQRGLYQRAVAP